MLFQSQVEVKVLALHAADPSSTPRTLIPHSETLISEPRMSPGHCWVSQVSALCSDSVASVELMSSNFKGPRALQPLVKYKICPAVKWGLMAAGTRKELYQKIMMELGPSDKCRSLARSCPRLSTSTP